MKGQFFGSDTFKLELTELSDGSHQIEIAVYYHAWGGGGWMGGAIYGAEPVVKRQFVSFAVNSPLTSPSPSIEILPSETPSSSPNPTPSPTLAPTVESTSIPEATSIPKQQTGFLGTNLPMEYGYAIVAVLVIIVVAGLSLVYFKKQRRK